MKVLGTKLLSGIFGIAVVVGLIAWGMSAQKKHDDAYPWKGAVLSLANEQRTIVDSKDFKTLQECRTWANKRLSDLDYTSTTGSFSCGTGCTWTNDKIVGGKRVNQYECTELVTE